jgi:hypothetical protein
LLGSNRNSAEYGHLAVNFTAFEYPPILLL